MVIQLLSVVFVVVGLFSVVFADEPDPDGRLQCREKAEKRGQEMLHSGKPLKKPITLAVNLQGAPRFSVLMPFDGSEEIVSDAALSGAPAKYRDFLLSELAASRAFAQENAALVNTYMASVVSWEEQYGLCPDMHKPGRQQKDEEVRDLEAKWRSKLQEYIRSRRGLYYGELTYKGEGLAAERYCLSEEILRKERNVEVPYLGWSLLSLKYGQKPTKPELLQSCEIEEIYPDLPLMNIQFPIFFEGHYVCELWLWYCLDD
jgi:hypothetical protein